MDSSVNICAEVTRAISSQSEGSRTEGKFKKLGEPGSRDMHRETRKAKRGCESELPFA